MAIIKKPPPKRKYLTPNNPTGKGAPKGRPFEKGKSGNPGGRTKMPEDLREARKINQIELERAINHYFYMTKDALRAALVDKDTPIIELIVGTIMAKAVAHGDHQRLEFILCRMLGRTKQQIEVTGPDGGPVPTLLTPEQRMDEINRLRGIREIAGKD